MTASDGSEGPPSIAAVGAESLGPGAAAGLGGAVLALVVPMATLWLALAQPSGFFGITPQFLRLTSLLVAAGVVLLLLSLVLYARGFYALRHEDGRFEGVAVLSLVGAVGLGVLVGACALLFEQPAAVATCVVSPFGPILNCLESVDPNAAYLGVAGFALGWSGGLGIAIGLVLASTRFERPEFFWGAMAYGALLAVLALPVEGTIDPIPGVHNLLLAGPPLALAAPGLVLLASRAGVDLAATAEPPSPPPPVEPTASLKTPEASEAPPMPDPKTGTSGTGETVTLAGGCFWCTEAVFSELRGVTQVIPGYTGGTAPHPSYEDVCTGRTGHAEAVEVTFDPSQLSLHDLFVVFFTTHDPSTLNRQGHDTGTQYRSAVFYHSPEQKETAEAVVREITEAAVWPKKIVTEIVPAAEFFPAEEYHRNYFRRNPERAYCQSVIAPKLAKFRAEHSGQLKFG